MSQNALSRHVNGKGKVILDTHTESEQHQNWTCSTGWQPGPTHQISWWSMNPFLRHLADKHSAHRHTDTRRWPEDLASYGAQVTNTTVTHAHTESITTARQLARSVIIRERETNQTVADWCRCQDYSICSPIDKCFQEGLAFLFGKNFPWTKKIVSYS